MCQLAGPPADHSRTQPALGQEQTLFGKRDRFQCLREADSLRLTDFTSARRSLHGFTQTLDRRGSGATLSRPLFTVAALSPLPRMRLGQGKLFAWYWKGLSADFADRCEVKQGSWLVFGLMHESGGFSPELTPYNFCRFATFSMRLDYHVVARSVRRHLNRGARHVLETLEYYFALESDTTDRT